MPQVKRNKDKKHSTIGDCEVTASNCNELKMFQLFKNDGSNQSHSLVFKISKTSLTTASSSTVMTCNESRIFPSYIEANSIEKIEKGNTETGNSSVQNKKEKTSFHEHRKSVKDDENQSHYVSLKISKTSEIETPTSSTVISSKEDKIFPSHHKVTFKESEKNYAEIVNSSGQIIPFLSMENQKSSVFEPRERVNGSGNQSHDVAFKLSETSGMQTSTNLTVMPSNKNKIFSSHHEVNFIESLEDAETESLSNQIVQSPGIKKTKTNIPVRRENLNNDAHPSHSQVFKAFKTSKIETSSSSIIPFNEDKICSSYYELNSTKKTEKNDTEIANSSIQIPLSPTIKKEKTNCYESSRSLSDGENQSHSPVFKISETCEIQTISNSTVILSNKEQIFSLQNDANITENLKENGMKTANYSYPTPLIPEIKKEKDSITAPRRSLRLLELQNKLKSSQAIKTNPSDKKQATKRKLSVNSALPPTKISHGHDFIHPSAMNLKSMILIPASRESLTSSINDEGDNPKFRNMDPSQVLSSLTQQEDIVKSLESGKTISLFFPDGYTSQAMRSGQNNISQNEKLTPQYKFKKANFGIFHLSKKYPMMDLFTLDKCYAMSNCSVRKTEIMLLDIIAGKEVFSIENSDFNCNSIGRNNYVEMSHFYSYWLPPLYCESVCKEHFNKRCYCDCDKDPVSREIIVQSLKILYDEEAIL